MVLATSSGTMNKNLLSEGRDFYQAVTGSTGSGMFTFRTADGEHVMAVTSLVPYAAGNVTAMRLVTSLTLVDRQWYSTLMVSFGVAAVVLFSGKLPFLAGIDGQLMKMAGAFLMAMLCAAGVYGVSAARQIFRARTF